MDSLVLRYRPACADGYRLAEWRVPGRGDGFDLEGMYKVRQLGGGADSRLVGVSRDSRNVGLFVEGFRRCKQLASETTWVCASKAVGDAMETYASHAPRIIPAPRPPVGWSTWE